MTFFLPLGVLVMFVSAMANPERQVMIASSGMAFVIVCIAKLGNVNIREPSFWIFTGFVSVFAASSIFFFAFLDAEWFRYVFAIFTSFIVWLISELIFRYLYMRDKYQPHSLEHLVGYVDIVIVFYVTSSLIALTYFTAISQYILLSVFIVVMAIVLVIHGFITHIPDRKMRMFVVTALWILTQWYWVISFLPLGNYVLGLGAAVIFYIFVNLAHKSFHASLDKTAVKRYITVGAVVLLVALLSAEWV